MLDKLDDETYINTKAIAFVRFSKNSGALEAAVKFLDSTTSTATFSGEAASTLEELINVPAESDEPPSGRGELEDPLDDPFQPIFTRTKGWYHYERKDEVLDHKVNRRYFLAFVNAKGRCSMRTFDAETGRFEGKKYRDGNYQEVFDGTLRAAIELTVESQPNLERDCRERLPDSVLEYLKSQVREKLGASNDTGT